MLSTNNKYEELAEDCFSPNLAFLCFKEAKDNQPSDKSKPTITPRICGGNFTIAN
jgi:hypothetical protein